MKSKFLKVAIAFVASVQLSISDVKAQSRAACVPKDGYWILVSNLHVKKVTTVQFYTNENQLIYEEVVRDQKMDLKRLKTLRCLKKGLDAALVAWNFQKQALYNKDWVAANLRH